MTVFGERPALDVGRPRSVRRGPAAGGGPVDAGLVASVRAVAVALDAAVRRRLRWGKARSRLFDLELDVEVADARQRIEVARARKHRHDMVNAFTAVEGAVMLLTNEAMTASDRSRLVEVLQSGLSRLHVLLLDGPDQGPDQVTLAELVTALAAEPGWGDRFHVDVAPDLVVVGSPAEVAETVRQLMSHVVERAPTGALGLRARRDGDRIELSVDDRGPRLSNRERHEMRGPDPRPFFGAGGVQGLHVAIRLARAQGGDVRAEPRLGGGESFAISLPALDG